MKINANLTKNIAKHQIKMHILNTFTFLDPLPGNELSHLIKFMCSFDLLQTYIRIHCDCTSKQMPKCNIELIKAD